MYPNYCQFSSYNSKGYWMSDSNDIAEVLFHCNTKVCLVTDNKNIDLFVFDNGTKLDGLRLRSCLKTLIRRAAYHNPEEVNTFLDFYVLLGMYV